VPIVGDLDHIVGLELGQLPAHRLDGETQEVGDISPAQRQIESRHGAVLGWVDMGREQIEEARHLFGCGLAAQRHHPVTRLIEFAQRLHHDAVLHRPAIAHQRFQRRLGEHAEFNVRSRLSRYPAFACHGSPQQIGGKLQPDHLLAAVFKHLGQLDHAAQYIGIGGDRHGIGDQFLPRLAPHAPRMLGQRRQLLGCQRPANSLMPRLTALAQNRNSRIVNVVANCLHGSSS
jgi:hypothetical protein